MGVAEPVAGVRVNFLLLIGLVGLVVSFFPSALAVLKGNFNKGQVIKFQLILFVLNLVIIAAVAIFPMVLGMMLPKMIYVIAGGLWLLVCIALWFYILIKALRDM